LGKFKGKGFFGGQKVGLIHEQYVRRAVAMHAFCEWLVIPEFRVALVKFGAAEGLGSALGDAFARDAVFENVNLRRTHFDATPARDRSITGRSND